MMPPPIAANIPSLSPAISTTGPPNTDPISTPPKTGMGSIPPSSFPLSSSFFTFFFLGFDGLDDLLVRTCEPIGLLPFRDGGSVNSELLLEFCMDGIQ